MAPRKLRGEDGSHGLAEADDLAKVTEGIGRIVSLGQEEIAALTGRLVRKVIARNGYLLREGQVCDFVGFVATGALVYAVQGKDGQRKTIDFALEGDWISDNRSRLEHLPSSIAIKAIEASEVLLIRQRDLDELYERHPRLERLGRILMEQAYLKMVEQSIELQLLPARERYGNLLSKRPHIFQKIPLYHVASYLGIAPKSLSRIRGDKN